MKLKVTLACLLSAVILLPGLSFSQQLRRSDFTPRSVIYKPLNRTVAPTNPAPMIVDTLGSIQDIIPVLFGPGVTVSNLTYSGPPVSIGIFYDTTGTFGIDTGIVMTTGNILTVPGPNLNGATSTCNGLPGDGDLNGLIPGYTTFDASVIEFDFTPQTDTLIAAKLVFASEEYLEWVGSAFNDVFGFFISGPGFSGLENLAVIDSLGTNICVNNINDLTNPQYYIDNTGGIVTDFDGYTTQFLAQHTITPGLTYHFKIAIADGGDCIYDAGIFMKANSFLGYACMPAASFTYQVSGNTVTFNNTTPYARDYKWHFGDGLSDSAVSPVHTYATSGPYTVTLEAYNYYQVSTFTQNILVGGPTGTVPQVQEPEVTLNAVSAGTYHVKVNSAGGPVVINLYSLGGSLVFSKTFPASFEENIALCSLSKGIYTMQVVAGQQVVTKKIVN